MNESMGHISGAPDNGETFTSINRWQNETFPLATAEGILKHLKEEWEEFLTAPDVHNEIVEAVDLIILLTGYISKRVKDFEIPQATTQAWVDRKMHLNRLRSWNIQPDGTGRHK